MGEQERGGSSTCLSLHPPPSRPRATRPPLSLHFPSQLLLNRYFVFVFLFYFNQLIVSTVCFFLSLQRGAFDE